jgi:hypothetical protein
MMMLTTRQDSLRRAPPTPGSLQARPVMAATVGSTVSRERAAVEAQLDEEDEEDEVCVCASVCSFL